MIFCLVGAHRVGKTTLMKKVAEKIGAVPLSLNLGEIQREIGFDSRNQSYSFAHRLKVQMYLIDRMAEIFEEHKHLDVIADRSPIDIMAYTLVHADDSLTQEQSDMLNKVLERCIEVARQYCIGCTLVQPGIPLIEDNETSAKCSKGFIEHLNALCFGLINDERLQDVPMYYVPRKVTDLALRIKVCEDALARSMRRNIETERKSLNKSKDFFFLANDKKH